MRKVDALRGIRTGLEAWVEPVSIPTYPVHPPDPNPMFLERRVYQGSSGRVYPLPFHDRVGLQPEDREYEALHLENADLYVMVLPEIGGRIHIGFDKRAGYDFFYRQTVVKPALVGLAGPWISGGVEFNWPQHHRPSTFMPCEWFLEEHPDGSRTFWLSEHEPMNRMKGMHGVCLYPDSTLVELKVRLYNRTPHVQTFLWWANVAARSHGRYQSFFPPDVRFVADHAKRATSAFPGCLEQYYGVRYGERAAHGVPLEELPPHFLPPHEVAPNRLDWYGNIPVPTSYMVTSTAFEFFGGYDHEADAGFVHVANRGISPGKKQWTWGNHDFGYAWDRNLTDDGGPYVELMAGVYTDNQPDFSFLAPYETKVFRQFWYPIRRIGPPVNATRFAALSIEGTRVGICPSSSFSGARIEVELATGRIERQADLRPSDPFVAVFNEEPIAVCVRDRQGKVLVEFDHRLLEDQPEPEPATEPPLPPEVATPHELFLIGVHLDQYRHATRAPEPYWEEALRRDPEHAPSHLALGKRFLTRGLFQDAERCFRAAQTCLTRRNPNPSDGEPSYQLGVVLELQGRSQEAHATYAKAAWNYAWAAASRIGTARLQMRERRFEEALGTLAQARMGLGDANAIGFMRAAAYRQLGRTDEARREAEAVLGYDPLDHACLYEAARAGSTEASERLRWALRDDVQNWIDLALELRACGLHDDADEVLRGAPGRHPIVALLLGERADQADPLQGLFPNRLQEMIALEQGVERHPDDWAARTLLGHFYYDRRRYDEAIAEWEASVALNPRQSVAWRNLGIAYTNVRADVEAGLAAYGRAVEADPSDARLVYEQDQLRKRARWSPANRLASFEAVPDFVVRRDDLTLELASLYNQSGQPERAVLLLESRTFTPWEGGEGIALAQHARAHLLLSRKALRSGSAKEAVRLLELALSCPERLGEARHLLANASDLWIAMGDALLAAGDPRAAEDFFRRAAEFRGDFQEMEVRNFSEMTYFRALGLRRLGREDEARDLLAGLESYADRLAASPAKIDYFATSLPTMLLFPEDLAERQSTTATFLKAQARLGLGHRAEALTLLREVLRRDPCHAAAQDLLQTMESPTE